MDSSASFVAQPLDLSRENWDDTALIRAYHSALRRIGNRGDGLDGSEQEEEGFSEENEYGEAYYER